MAAASIEPSRRQRIAESTTRGAGQHVEDEFAPMPEGAGLSSGRRLSPTLCTDMIPAPHSRIDPPSSDRILTGKVAIITGAAGGIGAATARLFAAEGAQLVLVDNDVSRDGASTGDGSRLSALVQELSAAGAQIASSTASVAEADGVASVIELTQSRFGRVDTLIHSAGIVRDGSLVRMNEADFDAVLSVNLKSTFLCITAVARAQKLQGGGGSIVCSTGTAGLLGNYGQAGSAAAAGGIYGLLRTASIELQRHGIRVNGVAPIAKTRLTEDLPMFEKVETMRAEHVAPVHLFLGSNLSTDTTGTVVSVAGGRLCTFKLVESTGQFKDEDDGVWSAHEIATHFATLRK
jgi:NAD(P)-dependent dehydrogenase (short-subunit alcohol dehydrogenase family)